MNAEDRSQQLTETVAEQVVTLPPERNLTDAVLDLEQRSPRHPVYAIQDGRGGWSDISITAFLDTVRSLARALISQGVQSGEPVAVMSATSYHWAVLDQALWFAGAVSVPIYETSSAHQIEHILRDSGARWVFIGDEDLRARVEQAQHKVFSEHDDDAAAVPAQHSSTDQPSQNHPAADDPAGDSQSWIAFFGSAEAVKQLSASAEDTSSETLEQRRAARMADDLATIVYTSGTTGTPRGVRITHRNLAEGGANILSFVKDLLPTGEGSRTILFLPLAHVLARAVQLLCLYRGIKVAHTPDSSRLLDDLASFRPTWLLAVPRVLEKVFHGARQKAHGDGKGKIFDAAVACAQQYSQQLEAQQAGTGSGPSWWLRTRRRVFSALVYEKLRQRMGGELEFIVSGASPLNVDIAHFFAGMGFGVQEGYGLTETTAPITLNIPGYTRIGSVGLPVYGHTVRIAEDSEILLKGPVVCDGYFQDQEATEDSFDENGFFRSGDLGSLDENGFLTITGRKKDLIVTASGKNVYPTPMEEAIRADSFVEHVVVCGDGRSYVAALITLDADKVRRFIREHRSQAKDLTEVLADEALARQLHERIQTAVDAANEKVSRAESIRRFRILDTHFTEASGHITPSMKLARAQVMQDFAHEIDDMYAESASPGSR